jgi:erythronate-4-phosphate dehydrogenase
MESVLAAQEIFSAAGTVTVVPDKLLTSYHLAQADVLITRSNRRIDAKLLANTSVKLVATATAGFDHFDTVWMQQQSITWKNAPGCNANSVAEYIIAALLYLYTTHQLTLANKTLGIIGYGHAGSALAAKAAALGLKVIVNDPPLQATGASGKWVDLPTLLQQADIVSLHVPLVNDGLYPTAQLANAAFFQQMQPGSVFINTARGEITDYQALYHALTHKHIAHAIIDVWPQEPAIEPTILNHATIATPHIAGHSLAGKLRGTWQAYIACCEFFNIPITAGLPAIAHKNINLENNDEVDRLAYMHKVVQQAYNIAHDNVQCKKLLSLSNITQQSEQFQQLRKHYPARLEFANCTITNCNSFALKALVQLGFPL